MIFWQVLGQLTGQVLRQVDHVNHVIGDWSHFMDPVTLLSSGTLLFSGLPMMI